jgi:hypothetical protein
MKSKTFAILCVAFCLLAAAAFYTLRKDRSGAQNRMGERLFADLPVDTITQIDVTGPEASVHLKKGPKVWVVEDRYGYPAAFDKVAELVKKIRDLKVGRTFKADSAVKERLALLDPQSVGETAAQQKGTRVVLRADVGAPPLADLLIGRARQSGSATGGHHIMRMDSGADDVVYLVDQTFRFLNAAPDDWLSKDLVAVAPEAVQRITCHDLSSGELVYSLVRSEKGKAPTLEGASENEAVDPAKVERVLGALSALTLDGVAGPRGAVEFTGLENPRRFEYRLFDGSAYSLETGRRGGDGGDRHYLSVTTAYHQPPQAAGEDATAGLPKTKGKTQQLAERLQPWTFTISTWKYEGLIYDRDGLLQQKG